MAWSRKWHSNFADSSDVWDYGHHIGRHDARAHTPQEGSVCDVPMSSPWQSGYSEEFSFAVYEPGKIYCLAWPTKNHAAAGCTNAYIPDTSLIFSVSKANPSNDPPQEEFNQRNINELAGLATNCDPDSAGSNATKDECQLGLEKHEQGKIDCKGFQRSPKFCDNTDKAMGTGCFRVPEDMSPGHYVGQWYWEFNVGGPYATCFDFQIVAEGSEQARGGLSGTTGDADTSQLPCKNNVLKFDYATRPERTPSSSSLPASARPSATEPSLESTTQRPTRVSLKPTPNPTASPGPVFVVTQAPTPLATTAAPSNAPTLESKPDKNLSCAKACSAAPGQLTPECDGKSKRVCNDMMIYEKKCQWTCLDEQSSCVKTCSAVPGQRTPECHGKPEDVCNRMIMYENKCQLTTHCPAVLVDISPHMELESASKKSLPRLQARQSTFQRFLSPS